MIDFRTTYELLGRSDQILLASPWKGRRDINPFAIARGEADLPEEVTFVRGEGECRADIVGTGFASLYAISDRLVQALTAEGITGWKSSPIRFADGTASYGAFHLLSVTGRCGPIRYDMSDVIEKVRGGKTTKWWIGKYFEASTWDGSDIFTPAGWATVLIDSRTRELLRLYDLDGVEPVPLSSIERMIVPSVLR